MALTQVQADVDHLNDEELVGRARTRDELAVRTITRRYNRRLFRVARSILRDDAEAEDVVQETYVRAFTGLDMFRGDAAFGTWITRIAMNETLGRVRRRGRPSIGRATAKIAQRRRSSISQYRPPATTRSERWPKVKYARSTIYRMHSVPSSSPGWLRA
jgi:RNA polymerase sigma-70 factor (ECF subfamily)